MSLKKKLYKKALSEGFSKVGICKPDSIPETEMRLKEFLGNDFHGQMSWMKDTFERRSKPVHLWSEVKSIIMFADLYTPKNDPMALQKSSENGMISVYAQNRDYHDIIKKRLKKVGGWLVEQQPSEQIKVFVDTAPLMEKPLAQAAGIGWQGKHTNLVSRDLGNWFFLGSILTTIELEPDSPELDSCGTCRACLDICPTNAFPAPYKLDATKCISYLTIEHRGPVDINLRGYLGNHIYGCDDCLAVCPWNKFAKIGSEIRYSAREDLRSPNLGDLSSLNDSEFRKKFSGSPVKRIGRNRFVRNVLYAIGNSQSKKLAHYASKLTNDTDYAVSDAAKWALKNINVDP